LLGPVGITINTEPDFIKWYSDGIIDSEECIPKIKHAVLAVGYGTDKKTGKEFLLFKNSWGTTWGINGFGKIALD
jgi:C1A family cysteine protease